MTNNSSSYVPVIKYINYRHNEDGYSMLCCQHSNQYRTIMLYSKYASQSA